jgi:hypothetical protein
MSLEALMALSLNQVKDVCFLNGGCDQCRYLDDTERDVSGKIIYLCKKLSPDRVIIDEELDEFYVNMKKSGQDPMKQGNPLADNCQGYLSLKTKKQGYDC